MIGSIVATTSPDMVLTLDDGPDPDQTPQVLEVLAVGRRALRRTRPDARNQIAPMANAMTPDDPPTRIATRGPAVEAMSPMIGAPKTVRAGGGPPANLNQVEQQ